MNRMIDSVEELDALPVGTVIRTTEGRVALLTEKWGRKVGKNAILSSWFEADEGEWAIPTDELDDLPAELIYTPNLEETK